MQVFHFGVFTTSTRNECAALPSQATGATLLGGGARSYRIAIILILRRTIVTCEGANPRAKSISGDALGPL
jgi:hypothetical protein